MEDERNYPLNGTPQGENNVPALGSVAPSAEGDFDLDLLSAEFERLESEIFGDMGAATAETPAFEEPAFENSAFEEPAFDDCAVDTVAFAPEESAFAPEESAFAPEEPAFAPEEPAFAPEEPAFAAEHSAPEASAIEAEIPFDDLEWAEDEKAPAADEVKTAEKAEKKLQQKKRAQREKKKRKTEKEDKRTEKALQKANQAEEKAHTSEKASLSLYGIIYDLGYAVIRVVTVLSAALLRAVAKPVRAFIKAAGIGQKRKSKGAFDTFRREFAVFREDLNTAKAEYRRVYRDSTRRRKMIRRFVRFIFKNHRYMLKTALNTLLPIGAAVIYLFTSGYWSSVTFALEVTYRNQSLGYISDESVYLEAQNLIEEKMDTGAYAFVEGENVKGELDAEYTLKLVSLDELNDADTICDKVIETSADKLTSACGVYVDDVFMGAVKNEADARAVLDTILAPYEKEAEEQDYVVGFAENVRYLQGLYSDREGIILDAAQLSEKLEQGHYLRIQKTVTSTETVKVPFDTIETKDNTKYQGYSVVTKKGVEGISRVTTTKIYIDDELTGAEQESTVIREPIPEERTVGGKGYYGGGWVGSPSSSGFLWPAPSCNYISSPYGYRSSGFHKGTDFCRAGGGANGTAIIASRAGTVEYAGYNNSGYGYMVLINHGNGYKTRYGHMQANSICVTVGEEVYAGQQLGRLGSTGNSTGPHLHFEIIYYGEYKNPMNYLNMP